MIFPGLLEVRERLSKKTITLRDMRHFICGPIPKEINALFEELGYRYHECKHGAYSFKRVIHEKPFPRFHIYVRLFEKGIELDLHLDQEHPRQKGNHDADWAYEGPVLRDELLRIEAAIEKIKSEPVVLELKPKKTFWQILLNR